MKTFNFVDENQLPMEKETISNCRKAIDVYRKLSKDTHYNVRISAFPTIVREQGKKHANQAFQPRFEIRNRRHPKQGISDPIKLKKVLSAEPA